MKSNCKDRLLDEKIIKQKLINSSLGFLIKYADSSLITAEESVKMVDYTIKDYESEDYIVLDKYKEKYIELRGRLK